jgi:hypothetical protein
MPNEERVCYNGFIDYNGVAVRMKPLISLDEARSIEFSGILLSEKEQIYA